VILIIIEANQVMVKHGLVGRFEEIIEDQ